MKKRNHNNGLLSAAALTDSVDQPVVASPHAARTEPDGALARLDLLEYVSSMSADFAQLTEKSRFPRLAMLLEMVSREALRERDGLRTGHGSGLHS